MMSSLSATPRSNSDSVGDRPLTPIESAEKRARELRVLVDKESVALLQEQLREIRKIRNAGTATEAKLKSAEAEISSLCAQNDILGSQLAAKQAALASAIENAAASENSIRESARASAEAHQREKASLEAIADELRESVANIRQESSDMRSELKKQLKSTQKDLSAAKRESSGLREKEQEARQMLVSAKREAGEVSRALGEKKKANKALRKERDAALKKLKLAESKVEEQGESLGRLQKIAAHVERSEQERNALMMKLNETLVAQEGLRGAKDALEEMVEAKNIELDCVRREGAVTERNAVAIASLVMASINVIREAWGGSLIESTDAIPEASRSLVGIAELLGRVALDAKDRATAQGAANEKLLLRAQASSKKADELEKENEQLREALRASTTKQKASESAAQAHATRAKELASSSEMLAKDLSSRKATLRRMSSLLCNENSDPRAESAEEADIIEGGIMRLLRQRRESVASAENLSRRCSDAEAALEDMHITLQVQTKAHSEEMENIRLQGKQMLETSIKSETGRLQSDFRKNVEEYEAKLQQVTQNLEAAELKLREESEGRKYYQRASRVLVSLIYPLRCRVFDLLSQKAYLMHRLRCARQAEQTEKSAAALVKTLAAAGAVRATEEEITCWSKQRCGKNSPMTCFRIAGVAVLATVRLRRAVGTRYGSQRGYAGTQRITALRAGDGSDDPFKLLRAMHKRFLNTPYELDPVHGASILGVGTLLSTFRSSMEASRRSEGNIGDALRGGVAMLTKRLRDLSEQCAHLDHRLKGSNDELVAYKKECSHWRAECISLQNSFTVLNERISSVQSERANTVPGEAYQSVLARCAKLESELLSARDERLCDQNEISEMKKTLALQVDASVGAEKTIRLLEDQNASIREEIVEARKYIQEGDVAKMSVSRLNESLLDEKKRVIGLRNEVKVLQRKVDAAEHNLSAAQTEKKSLQSKMEVLNDWLNHAKGNESGSFVRSSRSASKDMRADKEGTYLKKRAQLLQARLKAELELERAILSDGYASFLGSVDEGDDQAAVPNSPAISAISSVSSAAHHSGGDRGDGDGSVQDPMLHIKEPAPPSPANPFPRARIIAHRSGSLEFRLGEAEIE